MKIKNSVLAVHLPPLSSLWSVRTGRWECMLLSSRLDAAPISDDKKKWVAWLPIRLFALDGKNNGVIVQCEQALLSTIIPELHFDHSHVCKDSHQLATNDFRH